MNSDKKRNSGGCNGVLVKENVENHEALPAIERKCLAVAK